MRYKYPRTFHVPWSEGCTNDDKKLSNTNHINGKRVIVTEKMDGENTSIYRDGYIHARSLDSSHHNSQSYVKQFASKFSYLIGEDIRICGENMFAKHSIVYDNLDDYFLAFSVWINEKCMCWDQFLDYCYSRGVSTVPILYDGIYDERLIKALHTDDSKEGYVVRLAESFTYDEFEKSVAKFVRKDHVQTDQHWKSAKITKNRLKER